MRRLQLAVIAIFVTTACGAGGGGGSAGGSSTGAGPAAAEPSGSEQGGGGEARDDEFQLSDSDDAEQAHGEHPSEIEATRTEAAMRLFVVDPETGPIEGIVIKMTAPDGTAYYTEETDSVGYAEVLVPVGQRYDIEYLSLGRRNTTASVEVPEGPNQDIRLTMRHRRRRPPPAPEASAPETETDEPAPAPEQRFVLEGVLFESGSATIQEDSYPRLDRVVEYMTHRPSTRIRVAGHTDNVGNPQRNQALSEARAESVRDYLVEQGIDAARIEAVGYGDQQPIASNDTDEGRAQNRRIEAIEL
ncbi:MAG TPA: OmpA family protein [Sandaracinaceae bacterium LLY-WYZ-13_1]|nr:OmpA family protein [Sandaracinaceae bacterium LLY-WYZ-13_1]